MTSKNKLVILAEMAVVTAVPLCLALLHLPQTIIPLILLGWLSLWLRHKSLKEIGLRRPVSWLKVILLGSSIAAIGVFLSEKAISPLLLRWTGETPPPLAEFAPLKGNFPYFLFLLVGIWLLAAVGEELVYRGYVLNRLIDLLGSRQVGWGIGLVVSSLLFSLGHGSFNRTVILGGFLLGLVEGGLYLANRRNLWLAIIFHGTWDSIFVILFFLGLSLR